MKKYIAVIDDATCNLLFIKFMLERLGFGVYTFRNPLEAIKIIPALYVEAVFVDYLMFDTDGLDVIEKLRESEPNNNYILWTSFDDCDIRQYCHEHDITYLEKKLDIHILKEILGIYS